MQAAHNVSNIRYAMGTTSAKDCWHFHTYLGCADGHRCRLQHRKLQYTRCVYHGTARGCKLNGKCPFVHIDPPATIKKDRKWTQTDKWTNHSQRESREAESMYKDKSPKPSGSNNSRRGAKEGSAQKMPDAPLLPMMSPSYDRRIFGQRSADRRQHDSGTSRSYYLTETRNPRERTSPTEDLLYIEDLPPEDDGPDPPYWADELEGPHDEQEHFKQRKICRFHMTPRGCRLGLRCKFSHDEPYRGDLRTLLRDAPWQCRDLRYKLTSTYRRQSPDTWQPRETRGLRNLKGPEGVTPGQGEETRKYSGDTRIVKRKRSHGDNDHSVTNEANNNEKNAQISPSLSKGQRKRLRAKRNRNKSNVSANLETTAETHDSVSIDDKSKARTPASTQKDVTVSSCEAVKETDVSVVYAPVSDPSDNSTSQTIPGDEEFTSEHSQTKPTCKDEQGRKCQDTAVKSSVEGRVLDAKIHKEDSTLCPSNISKLGLHRTKSVNKCKWLNVACKNLIQKYAHLKRRRSHSHQRFVSSMGASPIAEDTLRKPAEGLGTILDPQETQGDSLTPDMENIHTDFTDANRTGASELIEEQPATAMFFDGRHCQSHGDQNNKDLYRRVLGQTDFMESSIAETCKQDGDAVGGSQYVKGIERGSGCDTEYDTNVIIPKDDTSRRTIPVLVTTREKGKKLSIFQTERALVNCEIDRENSMKMITCVDEEGHLSDGLQRAPPARSVRRESSGRTKSTLEKLSSKQPASEKSSDTLNISGVRKGTVCQSVSGMARDHGRSPKRKRNAKGGDWVRTPKMSKHSEQCGPTSKHSEQCGPTSKHSEQCRPTSKHSEQCGPTSKHSEQCRPTSKQREQCRPTSKHSEQCRPTSKHSEQCRPTDAAISPRSRTARRSNNRKLTKASPCPQKNTRGDRTTPQRRGRREAGGACDQTDKVEPRRTFTCGECSHTFYRSRGIFEEMVKHYQDELFRCDPTHLKPYASHAALLDNAVCCLPCSTEFKSMPDFFSHMRRTIVHAETKEEKESHMSLLSLCIHPLVERDLGLLVPDEAEELLTMVLFGEESGKTEAAGDAASLEDAVQVLRSTGKFELSTSIENMDMYTLSELYERLTRIQQNALLGR